MQLETQVDGNLSSTPGLKSFGSATNPNAGFSSSLVPRAIAVVVFPLLVCAGCAGCAPEPVSLQDVAVTGTINGDDIFFDFAGFSDVTNVDNCPTLQEGGVTFDGRAAASVAGGVYRNWLFGDDCFGIFVTDTVAGERRDAALEVTSGGTTQRLLGNNLIAERTLEPVAGLRVNAGEVWQLRYGGGDIGSGLEAYVRNSPVVLAPTVTNGVIDVPLPRDLPSGVHELVVNFGLFVEVTESEGFSTCEIGGSRSEVFTITVR